MQFAPNLYPGICMQWYLSPEADTEVQYVNSLQVTLFRGSEVVFLHLIGV